METWDTDKSLWTQNGDGASKQNFEQQMQETQGQPDVSKQQEEQDLSAKASIIAHGLGISNASSNATVVDAVADAVDTSEVVVRGDVRRR